MTYAELPGAEPNPTVIASLKATLRPGEQPLLGARSERFQFEFHDLQPVTLLLTSERLLVAKEKLLGKPKANVAVELAEIASCGCGPLYGTGPTWEAHLRTLKNSPAVVYFDNAAQAEGFKDALKAAAAGTPTPAEGDATAPSLADCRSRLHDLLDELRPLATPEMLGRPFGEGAGLDLAMQAAFRHLEGPDDCRRCTQLLVMDVFANTKDDQTPTQMVSVMGGNDESAVRYQLDDGTRGAVVGIAAAAYQLLAEWEGPGRTWDLWRERDDVAAELLCWHSVARLRMATAAIMPPVAQR